MTTSETTTINIDIWSDVVCPWCYIGKRKFESALSKLGDDISVNVTYRAYQLDPTASPGKTEPVRGVYERKFGGPQQADQIISHVSSVAAEVGLEFRMNDAQRANTLLAHRLIWRAGQPDSPLAQSEVKELLLASYFTNGNNIGDPDELATLMETLGADHSETIRFLDSDEGKQEVQSELLGASQLGITAVPTYVVEGQWSIPGAQEAETFERVLRRLADRMNQS
jgi:predicted DsbA family dithiol-disulfide isomerase